MKKLLMILISSILVFGLVACNGDAEATEIENTKEQVVENSEEKIETKEEVVEEIEGSETEEKNEKGQETDKADEKESDFPSPKYIGKLELEAGTYLFEFDPSSNPTMNIAFVKIQEGETELENKASELLVSENKEAVAQEAEFIVETDKVYTLEMGQEFGQIGFVIEEAGNYALIMAESPEDVDMTIYDIDGNEISPIE